MTVTPLGEYAVFRKPLYGGANYSGDGFYIVGVTGQIPLAPRLYMETGFEYSKHTLLISPNLPPNVDKTPYKSSFKLASIPVTLKMNFLKYLFVNGGCLLDLDTSSSSPIDNQTGLGAILGTGIQHDFKFGGSLIVNPYLKCHSLMPFSPGQYHQKLFYSGIRIGFMYSLSK
ncbi:MAG TPA: hypothetical protein VEV16_08565 [Daejeonella sp.]|nr:hypothetical protein [Daejeonella sp.]